MSRLADYFVVVGYDYNKERGGHGVGKIIQRFPEKDWDNCPFTQGIEQFCQPAGWQLTSQKHEPTFFVSALTDIDADRHYCACLTFSEDAAIEPLKEDDEYVEQDLALIRCSKVYAPKSLVLVSRLDYFETFRNCLGIIYTVHIENMQVSLETLVGNILGCIPVPPPGEPQIRFSVGAGDRQALQPPQTSGLPVTRSSVAHLFEQLGIANCLTIFCAALSDHKVLFHSSSYTRLTESGHALTALMYPLKYSYVYIPLLPIGLLEVLSTPTPFIAGVHTSLKPDAADLLDVVVADLDGGSIRLPENVHISLMPEPILPRMLKSLQLILRPELALVDLAFPPSPPKLPDSEMLDKEIRAIFLRFFAELFFGYRSCLTIIRIHPEPVITFHKANFLGHRGLIEDDFTTRVLDSMSFNTFVAERGKPYRVCDIFDEVFATMQDVLKSEDSAEKTLQDVRDLAQKLFLNENPNVQTYSQKIPRPTDGAHLRVHQPPFPRIDPVKVAEIIEDGMTRRATKANRTSPVWQFPKIVPIGSHISAAHDKEHLATTNARRLEVLRNCVNFIFENRISDARKIFPAVLRALKNKVARQALVEELSYNVRSNNRALLEHQQFDLVVRLLNSALQNDSVMDEYGIAAAILPLATAFCRKLYTGVIQFAYTCVQDHSVWASQQFWETAFYLDVQQQIRQLYLPQYESSSYPSSPKEGKDALEESSWTRDVPQRSDSKRWSASQGAAGVRTRYISALEIAAEQLRIWQTLTTEQQAEMISNEESTVYSQAIHYANRIVYMRIPLDATKKIREPVFGMEGESLSSMVTNSVAESDSFDAESGFEDQEVNEVGATVTKFVTRFIDKVCCESGVISDRIKSLHQIVPGIVTMHLESLDAVHQESKRLPPIQKPKILKPTLLPGEELVIDGLRCYLLPDGREEGTGGTIGGPVLLPAEGAIFLSNYRLIFRGTPCDPLACEQPVCRSYPISTHAKEKKMSAQYISHIDQWLQEATQLRSSAFQLMKIAFDDEVNSEGVENLKKTLARLRSPEHVSMTFAFTGGYISAQPMPMRKAKEKNASLRSIAKQTLLRTARKAGLRPKDTKKRQKFVMSTPTMGRKLPTAGGGEQFGMMGSEGLPVFGDDLSVIDEQEIFEQIQADSRNVERLAERSYCKDYARLGLGSFNTSQSRTRTDPFRLTIVNIDYSVCQSYPSILVVPNSISDDSLQKFARTHRQNRFPVVTWRHPVTKAVLVRASGFHGKGLIGMLKGHYNTSAATPGSSDSVTSVTLEQEKYFAALVTATPMVHSVTLATLDSPIAFRRSSSSSINQARQTLRRVFPSIRRTAGKDSTVAKEYGLSSDALGRASALYDQSRPGSASVSQQHAVDSPMMSKPNGSAIDTKGLGDIYGAQGLHKATLYVLGEKTQLKGIRLESFKKCDFIPVDYVEIRQIKSSFKKLMRACVPSAPFTDPEKGFLKAIQESEWLNQLQNVLQIAGAVIDLLDVQGSSVMVCLEEGWDFSTQVTSIAQILLDPYYRTFDGFRVLIEKEWLAFSHRFSHRGYQTTASQASGFAPIFLQFLDVVHQIHHQFPMSFEFNQYYLKFLAYHHVSSRFRTFMMDSELRRMESGWLMDENKARMDLSGVLECDPFSSSHRVATGTSIWEYIDQCRKKTPIFYNFMFFPHDHETVLRPFSHISNLKLWNYYVTEDLAHGSVYDFELWDEMRQDDESDIVDLPLTFGSRRIVNSCYDNVMQVVPDSCTYLLQEIHRLETEIGGFSPRGWMQIWDRLEVPPLENLQMSQPFQIDRSDLSRSTHKRSTIELLVRSKMLGEATKMFSQPHHFIQFNYTTPAYCDYCSQILWGLIKTGMHCSDCGYNCHEKCAAHVPKNCTKIKPVSDLGSSSTNVSGGNISDTASTTTGTVEKDVENYPEFVSNAAENRTHEGYLHKRGTLLKGWKQRWFVLDSMKHQLRYYDTQDDNNCKGYVDLKDVVSVNSVKNVQGAPKKADENAFFEMKTIRRVYQFLASDLKAAQEWIDKIQSCL